MLTVPPTLGEIAWASPLASGIFPCHSAHLQMSLAGSKTQQQIYSSVRLMEIFDWGKLEYDLFLLEVYHPSVVLCQLYKEDPNLFALTLEEKIRQP